MLKKDLYFVINTDCKIDDLEEIKGSIESDACPYLDKDEAIESFDSDYAYNYLVRVNISEVFENKLNPELVKTNLV